MNRVKEAMQRQKDGEGRNSVIVDAVYHDRNQKMLARLRKDAAEGAPPPIRSAHQVWRAVAHALEVRAEDIGEVWIRSIDMMEVSSKYPNNRGTTYCGFMSLFRHNHLSMFGL